MRPESPAASLRPQHAVLLFAALAIGLAIDVRTDLPGQVVLSAVIWVLLFFVLKTFDPIKRRTLVICLAIATAGELFLSLGWGLYTYRLENVPLFVPPGHVMMVLLGLGLSQRISSRAADAILGCAALYGLAAAAAGIDTFALPLLGLLALISFGMSNHRRLFASTFILALALELYGTWLGNWTWHPEVPHMALVTTNPPGIASALYAVLDACVACTALVLGAGRAAPSMLRVHATQLVTGPMRITSPVGAPVGEPPAGSTDTASCAPERSLST